MPTKLHPSRKSLLAKKKKRKADRKVSHASQAGVLRHTLIPEAPDAGVQDPRYQEAHETCGRDSRYAEAPDAGGGRGHQFIEGEFTQGRSQS